MTVAEAISLLPDAKQIAIAWGGGRSAGISIRTMNWIWTLMASILFTGLVIMATTNLSLASLCARPRQSNPSTPQKK